MDNDSFEFVLLASPIRLGSYMEPRICQYCTILAHADAKYPTISRSGRLRPNAKLRSMCCSIKRFQVRFSEDFDSETAVEIFRFVRWELQYERTNSFPRASGTRLSASKDASSWSDVFYSNKTWKVNKVNRPTTSLTAKLEGFTKTKKRLKVILPQ